MINFIRKYPLSLLVILTILFLSLFNPPKTRLNDVTNIDKIVHVCMYGGLELVIWIEYLRHHSNLNWVKILVLGIIAPIMLGGLLELAQMYLTQKRSGEWADLIADAAGVLIGAAVGYFAIQTIFRSGNHFFSQVV
ncbi:MAG: VanZ family protein [Bacteroidaceae bacterium]|nr:VanZ family protein [Bacteroidaceae bacterium]